MNTRTLVSNPLTLRKEGRKEDVKYFKATYLREGDGDLIFKLLSYVSHLNSLGQVHL